MSDKKYLVVVECAIEFDGKFLIIRRPEGKHAGGLLSFAGGKVDDQDESSNFDILRSAVKREIFEELGVHLGKDLKYITSEFFVDSYGVHVIANLFYFKFDTMPEVKPSVVEVPWYGWMGVEEINNAPNSPPWLKELMTMIINSR